MRIRLLASGVAASVRVTLVAGSWLHAASAHIKTVAAREICTKEFYYERALSDTEARRRAFHFIPAAPTTRVVSRIRLDDPAVALGLWKKENSTMFGSAWESMGKADLENYGPFYLWIRWSLPYVILAGAGAELFDLSWVWMLLIVAAVFFCKWAIDQALNVLTFRLVRRIVRTPAVLYFVRCELSGAGRLRRPGTIRDGLEGRGDPFPQTLFPLSGVDEVTALLALYPHTPPVPNKLRSVILWSGTSAYVLRRAPVGGFAQGFHAVDPL